MQKIDGFLVVDASGHYEPVTYLFGVGEQGGFHTSLSEAEAELDKVSKNPRVKCKIVKIQIVISDLD